VNYKFDFVKVRNKFFIISALITVLGLATLGFIGLNYGVDFKAGTRLEIMFNKAVTKEQAEQVYFQTTVGIPPELAEAGEGGNRISARFDRVLTDAERKEIITAFTDKIGGVEDYEESTVDPQMAKELALRAIWATIVASVGIIIYVSIRFEWRFALAAVIALLHDAFIVVSFFSIFRFEVNLPFVAAILTIIGYSINDTIVTFDRIRENLRVTKIKTFDDLADLVNKSIWQTMARSVNTVLTVVFAAVCLFIFGSESIRLFSLAMLVGLISGAYSSFFIASQIWVLMKYQSIKKQRSLAAAKS
jgi:preprotein translocase subunit SecF